MQEHASDVLEFVVITKIIRFN